MTTVLSLIKQFCTLDFVERNCEKALLLLTRDITWYGTSDVEDVTSREEAQRYISDEIRLLPTPYTVTFLDEKVVPTGDASGVAFLRARLTNAGVTVIMRITATSKLENGAEKLCSMHFSVADSAQEAQEYFPVQQGRRRAERAREELVMSTMAGGMMGGYCEPNFPFYFINARMLEYLGYADEAEFVADIAGKISNCMHAEDRERVERSANQQLSVGNQYTVDYRMKKKDGSYIWVHDIGRQIMTEDGRQAIISVCYDINEDYAKQIQLENVVNAVPGGMALYRLTESGLELLYQSDGVAALTGLSPEEYATLAKNDIRSSIYPEDEDRCHAAISQAVQTDRTVAIDFRAPHKDGGYVWISGSFCKTRVENGCPIIHAVFTEMPQLHELMYDITENSNAAIVVTDKNTRELLYINKAVSNALGGLQGEYSGRKCYEYLLQRTEPCEFCHEIMCDACSGKEREIHIPESDHHYLVRGHMASWAGHEARVEYLLDVSEARRAQQKLVEMAQNVSCGLCVAIAHPPEYKLDYQFINDGFCELFEHPKEDALRIIKKDLSHGIHPEDRHLVDEMRCNIFAGSRREDITYRYVLPDGRVKWIHDSIHALPGKDGSITLYASFFDVTEQKRQEQQLDELVNNITAGVAVRSIDTKAHTTHVIYVNQGLCNLLESTEQELCDRFEKGNGSYVDATGRQVLHNMAVALRNGDTHAEGTISCLLPGGRLRWMHLDVNTVPQLNGTITTYTTYSDMTTQVEQQTQLEDVIRNVPGGICLYRWTGVRLEPLVVSEQFSQLLGEDAYSVLAKTPGTDFIHTHPDDLLGLKQAMKKGFQNGSVTHVYRSWNSKTKEYLWIHMQSNAIPQADGTHLLYVSYTDITAERQMAQELRASEMAL